MDVAREKKTGSRGIYRHITRQSRALCALDKWPMNRDAAHTFSLYMVTIKNKKGRPPFIFIGFLLDFY
jgi:hypothetical protein